MSVIHPFSSAEDPARGARPRCLSPTVFVAQGIEEALIVKTFNAGPMRYLPFPVLQLGCFLAFILDRATIIRMPHAPKWAGLELEW